MWLLTNIRTKGCRRGGVELQRGSIACRENILWAAMTLGKYSEHQTEVGVNTSFLHIKGKEVG